MGWEFLNLVLKKIKLNCFCTYIVFIDLKVYVGYEKWSKNFLVYLKYRENLGFLEDFEV